MSVENVAEHLKEARRVLFITGAGVSADSGIPTYRGVGGLYEGIEDPSGYAIEEILSATMFAREPERTWKSIADIEEACRGGAPNAAHEIIAELDGDDREVWVLTQNVDGLHRRAGSSNLIELHGRVHTLRCTRCRYREEVEDFSKLPIPPHCPDCHALVRPDVVLFEEQLPGDALITLMRQLDAGFDLVFSVGTSSLFPYIVQPVIDAAERGVPTVEINPGETTISGLVRYHLKLGAADAMQRIREHL